MSDAVPFTQFLLPDGLPRKTEIPVPTDVARMAYALIAVGWRFEVEILGDGSIHMDCCNDDRQLASEIAPNGPEVPGAVERLIRAADEAYRG